jgi:glutamyl-tRNA synthetase
MPANETISFTDMIHGEVQFDSNTVDDKVLLKADGMPTYHLAVVVDDYLMKISHAFRGEEWLSSAPVHILLWKYLFGLDQMPQWAHLPLILGPNGKLSKRDGAKYGFPVFAMNWTDPRNNEFTEGFKEKGFLPEAFINMLAMLGWNSGSEQELFTKEELIDQFSIDRVHKSGAKFDYEKARWFNQEWIKRKDAATLYPLIKPIWEKAELSLKDDAYQLKVIELVKDRCILLTDFIEQGAYFFREPEKFDVEAIQSKWSTDKTAFFQQFIEALHGISSWSTTEIETCFKSLAGSLNIKPGDVQLPLRIMLVGGKFGPPVFDIASMIGLEATIHRINYVLTLLNKTA